MAAPLSDLRDPDVDISDRPVDPLGTVAEAAANSDRNLGARLCLAADGSVVGDDPRAFTAVSCCRNENLVFAVGVIEGLAEGLAAFTRIFSGALSDYFGRRKLLAELGYGLAAVSKLIFPLAPSVSWLLSARLLDRFGKGIRGAPRDALIADLSPPQLRGASFGLRQSLDTIGAFLGPLTAVLLMAATAGAFKVVFWVAAIPAFLSVAVLILGVREPEGVGGSLKVQRPARVFEPGGLGPSYWAFAMVAACLTMARFSEAFLLLRGQSVGLPIPWAPLLLVLMNIIYALAAWPAGAVSDAIGRGTVLGAGFALLIAADLALAFASSLGWLAVGVAIWGLHMGLTRDFYRLWWLIALL